jgi:hypothetical protein
MRESESANAFTVLDWIGVVLTMGQIMGLFFFPTIAVAFADMYADFGGSLPLLTRFVTQPWFTIVLGVICLSVFSLQWLKFFKSRLKRRRAVVVLSFLLASAAMAVCVIGLYLPIFKLASPIGS